MFRVTGEDDAIILETSHKATAQQSKLQYEASMGKKAKVTALDYDEESGTYAPKKTAVRAEKDDEDAKSETPEPQLTGATEQNLGKNAL